MWICEFFTEGIKKTETQWVLIPAAQWAETDWKRLRYEDILQATEDTNTTLETQIAALYRVNSCWAFHVQAKRERLMKSGEEEGELTCLGQWRHKNEIPLSLFLNFC